MRVLLSRDGTAEKSRVKSNFDRFEVKARIKKLQIAHE
jgi:hypothetical protein